MITSMFEIVCITNRKLCADTEQFLRRIAQIAANKPSCIILREKDLSPEDYFTLAGSVKEICAEYSVPLVLHSDPETALRLGIRALHMPLPALRSMPDDLKREFHSLGASCHSVEEAQEAVSLGADRLIAGHIFATDCKRGLPGRGTDFLRAVCGRVQVPVYAIGGIAPERVPELRGTGAAGICVMSGLMKCEDPPAYFAALRKEC